MIIKSKVTKKTLTNIRKITGISLTLGKLISSIRHGEEKTQANFSAKLGISRQQLCDIEHDRKIVSPKLAASYAELLGYSKEQFIRLAIQGALDKEGLGIIIEIIKKPIKTKTIR
jgi:transcriptional regulator with XRE-family HTH domain